MSDGAAALERLRGFTDDALAALSFGEAEDVAPLAEAMRYSLLAGRQGELVDLGQRGHRRVRIVGGLGQARARRVDAREQVGERRIAAHFETSPSLAMDPSTPFTNGAASAPA